MKHISKTKRLAKPTVNSIKRKKPTVNSYSTNSRKISNFIDEMGFSNDDLAETLANALGDQKSLKYYQLLTQNILHEKLIEALSYVKDADNRGVVKYKPVYFQGILRNWRLPIKFKKHEKTK